MGDRKCDGYLPSARKFYQCYAPDEIKLAETRKKIKSDFKGALPFASDFFTTWVFVHNSRDGRLPTDVVRDLESLRKAHSEVKIETMGFVELLREALALDEAALVGLLGPYPVRADFLSLRYEDITPILTYVAGGRPHTDSEVRPVPRGKLRHNRLGDDVRSLLTTGMSRAALVKEYLNRCPDKGLAAIVSASFRHRYEAHKRSGGAPDDIFHLLQVDVQGPFVQRPSQAAAALAVLAYLFEECDIFERPPEE
jgi:hypothetical protein